MYNILLSAGLAFLITFFAIPIIIQVAKAKKLFDEPDERKVHKAVIPTLGGLGIFAGFIIATLMGVPFASSPELQYFIAASTVIFFLGIKDDILDLSATKKFIGQLIAAGIVIKFGGVQINNMHGFMGINEIPRLASIVLTVFTIIVITNSFNLIDGIDGLAGSLGLLTSFVFGIYFYMAGQISYAVIAFSLSASTLGFLIYNFSPAKIFMGDTGSLLIGLINAILVIKFINLSGSSNNYTYNLAASPAIGFAILMIPLFDTLRVFAIRIFNGRSPFSPDRTHVHHFLLDLGLNHKQVTLICLIANIGFILTAYFLRFLGTTSVLAILLSTAFAFIGIIYYLRPKETIEISNKINNKVSHNLVVQNQKLFVLADEPIEVN